MTASSTLVVEETLERLENSLVNARDTLARAFVLDSNNEWATLATGLAICELSEDEHTLQVSLHETDDARTPLFSTTFHKEQDVARQQPTVVTWNANDGTDVALSFEHELGCDIFW